MKQTPLERAVTERMAPGVLCKEGFLGRDRRSLGEIIDADNSTLAARNVTHERVAARLKEILDQAVAALGTPVEVAPGLTATFHEAMGRIPSPWPGEGTFRKGHVELADSATGQSIRYTPLGVFLIAAHGFYQGKGGLFRLEPDLLCDLLGLGDE